MSSSGSGMNLQETLEMALVRLSDIESQIVVVGGEKRNFTKHSQLAASGRAHFWFQGCTTSSKTLPAPTSVVFMLKWVEPDVRASVEQQVQQRPDILYVRLNEATGQFNDWSKRLLEAWQGIAQLYRAQARAAAEPAVPAEPVPPDFSGERVLREAWEEASSARDLAAEAVRDAGVALLKLGEAANRRLQAVQQQVAEGASQLQEVQQEISERDARIERLEAQLADAHTELRTAQAGAEELVRARVELTRYRLFEGSNPIVTQMRELFEKTSKS